MELVSQGVAEKELKPFQNLEKKLQSLAQEIGQKKEDFHLIKKDRSEKDKIFAKLSFNNEKFKVSFWEKKNGGKKKVDPFDLIHTPLTGDVIIEVKHFFISPTNKAITCKVKEFCVMKLKNLHLFLMILRKFLHLMQKKIDFISMK